MQRTRSLRLTLASALCLIIAQAMAGPLDSTAPGALSISSSDLMRHLKFLADDALEGRDTGERGNEIASAYIADRFREFGLKPIGDHGGYFQRFRVDLNPKAGPNTALISRVDGKQMEHGLSKDYALFDNATRASAGGPLVFAGYGISSEERGYDDYAGIDVKGKVVLILRRSPRYGAKNAIFTGNPPKEATFVEKLKQAQDHGAAAVLLVDASKTRKPVAQESRDGVKPGGLEPGEGPPYAFVSFDLAQQWMKRHDLDLVETAAKIDEEHQPRSVALPGIRIEISVEITREKVPTRNVVGLLPGSDPRMKDEVVVVGGHLDHVGYGPMGQNRGNKEFIHNGADDNASGTSAVLELAEAFAVRGEWPKRSILFINFNAEERGLLGSRHYADHPLLPLSNTVAMVNLDMVGRGASGLDVGGVGTSPGFKPMVEAMARQFSFKFNTTPGGRGRSDHTSFYNKNIPVLFFYTGQHADYHKPSDEWEKINQPEIQSVTRMAWMVVNELANAPKRPPFTKSDGNPVRRGRPRLQLGVQMNPEPEEDGVRIDAVMPDSPAAKAGLLRNDVILSIAGRPTRNLRDVTLAVGRMKKGQQADIRVRRGKETLTVKPTF